MAPERFDRERVSRVEIEITAPQSRFALSKESFRIAAHHAVRFEIYLLSYDQETAVRPFRAAVFLSTACFLFRSAE
jgi:hypothetical protein